MRLFEIDMEYVTDSLKVIAVLVVTWFTDVLYVAGVNVAFISFPSVREYLLDIKDIMSFLITTMVLVITFIKMKSHLKRKK